MDRQDRSALLPREHVRLVLGVRQTRSQRRGRSGCIGHQFYCCYAGNASVSKDNQVQIAKQGRDRWKTVVALKHHEVHIV